MTKLILALMTSAAIAAPALAQPQTPAEPPARGQPDRAQPKMSPSALTPEDVRKVQQALSQKGMQVRVDGKWGPETQAALRGFQQRQGIRATGQLDSQTISALGVDIAAPAGRQPPGTSPGAPPSGPSQPDVPQPRQRDY